MAELLQGRVYLFNNDAMREALDGFDVRHGLGALGAAGWMAERDADKRSIRMQQNGHRGHFYAILPIGIEEVPGRAIPTSTPC